MENELRKIYLDWSWISQSIKLLASKYTEDFKDIDYITGLPRGGIIPAVMLSHALNIPYKEYNLATKDLENLIMYVDDIADTGKTLTEVVEELKVGAKFTTLSLFYREGGIFEPDTYLNKLVGDEWIVFPWEREDSETIQDYLV